jgi:hypothetical protein
MNKLVLLIALMPSISHSYCEIDGVNAVYKPVPDTRLQGVVAQAYRNNGKYIIEYSNNLNKYPKILQNHILAHECAHHKLKHTSMPIAYVNDRFEFEADCDAVKQLNWSETEVNELIYIWSTSYPRIHVENRSEALKKCLSLN